MSREDLLAKAAQDFIDKVDRGEARSKRSYAAFKAALGHSDPHIELNQTEVELIAALAAHSSPANADADDFAALREVEVEWLSSELARAISNLAYPVGMGIPPHETHIKSAADALFERYAKMIEMARRTGIRAQSVPLPGLVETLRSHANDCEDMERWATPELAPLLRRAADVIEGGFPQGTRHSTDSVGEYLADYEFRFEGGGGHVPTDSERAMLEDAIEGYMSSLEGMGVPAKAAEGSRPDLPEGEKPSPTAQCVPDRDVLAASFAKQFPAVLSQYSQFKIVDWFLSAFTSPESQP